MNRDLKFAPRRLRLPVHIVAALLLLGLPVVLQADALEDGAKRLRNELSAAAPLALVYDSDDALARPSPSASQ